MANSKLRNIFYAQPSFVGYTQKKTMPTQLSRWLIPLTCVGYFNFEVFLETDEIQPNCESKVFLIFIVFRGSPVVLVKSVIGNKEEKTLPKTRSLVWLILLTYVIATGQIFRHKSWLWQWLHLVTNIMLLCINASSFYIQGCSKWNNQINFAQIIFSAHEWWMYFTTVNHLLRNMRNRAAFRLFCVLWYNS